MYTENVSRQLPILLLISFDGFRYDYLNSTLTPNLYELSKEASLGHMESMYVTKTFPNHFSIATGLYEDEHEIINNRMFDPRLNETFHPGIESEKWWNPNGKAIPIWTANQVFGRELGQKRTSGSMMYPGSTTPIMNVLPNYLKKFNDVRNWTDNVETVIRWLTLPVEPANFVSIYFDDPDAKAHIYGPWGQPTLDSVRRIDSAAGYLVKRLREVQLADRTNILFVSDHGMAEITKTIYLDEILDTDTFDLHGNSPDWSIFVKPKYRHQKSKIFKRLITASKKNHFTVIRREDIPPQFHYSKTPRIGDFFLLVDEHYDLYKQRNAKPEEHLTIPWGNHGWRPSSPDMRPLFMAYGPSFKQDYYHEKIFPNIDLYPLMVFLLDLPADLLPNNGSLARILDVIDFNRMRHYGQVLKYDMPSLKPVNDSLIINLHLDSTELGAPNTTVTYLLVIGLLIFMLSSLVFLFVVGASKSKVKPGVDFDDLAPGLNIDLAYYLEDDYLDYKKHDKRRRKKEESAALLNG